MLNIASVNMPKIKPETKVLIIKNLKSKSPAEVADIFNVSKQQVERIRKYYQETGDVHDRPRLGRPRKTATARDDSLLVRLTAPGGVDIGFLLVMVSMVVLLLRNQRETRDS